MRLRDHLTTPGFLIDPRAADLGQGRQIDWPNVPDKFRVTAIKVAITANAAADATAIAVTALPAPRSGPYGDMITGNPSKVALPVGAVLYYGPDLFARVTAPALIGATSVTVEPLVTALTAGLSTYYAPSGPKFLPAGLAVGWLASSDGKKFLPRVATSNPAVGLLQTNAIEGAPEAALTGYGYIFGAGVYENMLPDAVENGGSLPAGIKTELAASGTGWRYEVYEDTIAASGEPSQWAY